MSKSMTQSKLTVDVSEGLTNLLLPEIRKLYRAEFQRIKNNMIADFRNHPVTIEIQRGVDSENISKTLGQGKGNLFSYIGFEKGSDPTQPIEEVLQSTSFQLETITKRRIVFSVHMPHPEDIFAVTPMPWASGRSWAKGIETGISGLGYYLFVQNNSSRSGIGIQSPRKVRKRGSKFKNTKYISHLINTYSKEFENINI